MYYTDSKKKVSPSKVIIRSAVVGAGVLAGFLICRFFLVPAAMPDVAMEPSIKKDETVLFLKRASFDRGDVVLADNAAGGSGVLIRRAVAFNGDTVEIRDGVLLVNGKPAYFSNSLRGDDRIFPIYFTHRDNMPVIKVMENEVFLMNDNSDETYDSRWFGTVPAESVIGVKKYKW